MTLSVSACHDGNWYELHVDEPRLDRGHEVADALVNRDGTDLGWDLVEFRRDNDGDIAAVWYQAERVLLEEGVCQALDDALHDVYVVGPSLRQRWAS